VSLPPLVARLVLPELYPKQRRLLEDPARDVCTVSATQIGKTFAEAAWLLGRAWTDPVRRYPWWWTAPTKEQVMFGFNYLLAFAATAGILAGSPITTPHPVVKLINGTSIEFRSRHEPQNLMGGTIAGGVHDEAGLMTWQQHGAVTTRRIATGGPFHWIGNPGVIAGPFRKLCALGEEARAAGGARALLYGTHRWTWQDHYRELAVLNPALAALYLAGVESDRETMWEVEFRRLHDAEWTEDEAAVFRDIDDLTEGLPLEAAAAGEKYSIGVDVGQMADYLVAIGIGKISGRADFMLRFRGVPYPQAADRLVELLARFPGTLWVETNGAGIGLFQDLDRRPKVKVQAFDTTKKTKEEAVQALAGALNKETRRLRLAKMEPLQHELKMYRYFKTQTGASTTYRYSAPEGEHDDCVMALALAWHGATAKLPSQGVFDYYKAKADEIRKAKEGKTAPAGTSALWRVAA
jgi:hypothetical protein